MFFIIFSISSVTRGSCKVAAKLTGNLSCESSPGRVNLSSDQTAAQLSFSLLFAAVKDKKPLIPVVEPFSPL